MSRKKISIELVNEYEKQEFQTKCIYNEETKIISYLEPNNIKVKLDLNNHKLYRKTEEHNIVLDFDEGKESTGKIYINDLDSTIYLKINTQKILITKDFINIIYIIDNKKYEYKLKFD